LKEGDMAEKRSRQFKIAMRRLFNTSIENKTEAKALWRKWKMVEKKYADLIEDPPDDMAYEAIGYGEGVANMLSAYIDPIKGR
jgi:hypothetical protein